MSQSGNRRHLQILGFVRRGYPKAPLWEGGGAGGGRGRARNLEVSFCFGYQPPFFVRDNCMNFPALQRLHNLACSPTRSRGSPLPEGAFCLCEHRKKTYFP